MRRRLSPAPSRASVTVDGEVLVRAEAALQFGDLHVVATAVGGHDPGDRGARLEPLAEAHQVVAPTPDAPGLGRWIVATPEGLERVEAGVHPEVPQARAPDRVGPQHLEGLGAVGDAGAQGVDSQAGLGVDLGGLVGVHEVARGLVQPQRGSVGQEVPQPIQHRDVAGLIAEVLERGRAHPAELVAARPAVPEAEASLAVDILEDQAVAEHALGERPLAMALGERLPEPHVAVGQLRADEGDGTRVMLGVVQPVAGEVGKQGTLGVDPTGGEAAVAGHEHPEVGVGGQVDQERIHPVEVLDPVIGLAVEVDEAVVSGSPCRGVAGRRRGADRLAAHDALSPDGVECRGSTSPPGRSPAGVDSRSTMVHYVR